MELIIIIIDSLLLLLRAFLRTLWVVWWWLVCRLFRLFSLRRDLSDAALSSFSSRRPSTSSYVLLQMVHLCREGAVRSAPLVRSRRPLVKPSIHLEFSSQKNNSVLHRIADCSDSAVVEEGTGDTAQCESRDRVTQSSARCATVSTETLRHRL